MWTPNYPKRHGREVFCSCIHNSSTFGDTSQSKHGLQSPQSTPGVVPVDWDYFTESQGELLVPTVPSGASVQTAAGFLGRSVRIGLIVYSRGGRGSSQKNGASHRSACA